MNMKTSFSLMGMAVVLGLALACGSDPTPPPPAPAVAITIAPTTATVRANATQTFTATVTNSTNTGVTWSVQEGATGGTVTSAGLYTAPATAGTYHVVATSLADTSKTATATVTVTPLVGISITPTAVNVATGANQTFTATVTNSTNTAVTWSVQEGATGGTVTSAGVYTAPVTVGTYHVVATSVADTTKTATAAVTVTIPAGARLDYTDPTTGTYRLLKDSSSTATHLVLNIVGQGASNGAGLAFTLNVDSAKAAWAKVVGSDVEFVKNGTTLNLGSAPQAIKGKVAGGSLTAALGQKGTAGSVALNGVLAQVALDLRTGVAGNVTFSAPKIQVLNSDGSIATVALSVGTLTVN